MKKIRTIFLIYLVSTLFAATHTAADDLFSDDEHTFFEASDKPVQETALHPFWDAPTYFKIAFYYVYYTYMRPTYVAVMAYVRKNNKNFSSFTA